jgi:hypothetical protein
VRATPERPHAGRVRREGGSRQDSRQPRPWRKTVTPSRAVPPDQVTQKPFGATHQAMLAIAQCPGTVKKLLRASQLGPMRPGLESGALSPGRAREGDDGAA